MMMSLYDYLGHPAGSKLGQQVAAAAAQNKIKFETRHVSTKNYTGDIMNSLPTQIRKVIGHIEFAQPLDNNHGRG